jgi:hypothetical protein
MACCRAQGQLACGTDATPALRSKGVESKGVVEDGGRPAAAPPWYGPARVSASRDTPLASSHHPVADFPIYAASMNAAAKTKAPAMANRPQTRPTSTATDALGSMRAEKIPLGSNASETSRKSSIT